MTKSPLANLIRLATIIVAGIAPAWALEGQLKSAERQNEIRLPRQAIQNAHQSRAGGALL